VARHKFAFVLRSVAQRAAQQMSFKLARERATAIFEGKSVTLSRGCGLAISIEPLTRPRV
jgi:hypothetical protein